MVFREQVAADVEQVSHVEWNRIIEQGTPPLLDLPAIQEKARRHVEERAKASETVDDPDYYASESTNSDESEEENAPEEEARAAG